MLYINCLFKLCISTTSKSTMNIFFTPSLSRLIITIEPIPPTPRIKATLTKKNKKLSAYLLSKCLLIPILYFKLPIKNFGN